MESKYVTCSYWTPHKCSVCDTTLTHGFTCGFGQFVCSDACGDVKQKIADDYWKGLQKVADELESKIVKMESK